LQAAALEQTVIEKHFTLNRIQRTGTTRHPLNPNELKEMVKLSGILKKAMVRIKKPSASELKNKIVARRSIHLVKEFKKGHVISENDLQ